MKQPYVVTFAGVQGTSKSPIAHFLSITFSLPIISTDEIRFEVREDWRLDTIVGNTKALEEFRKRATLRTEKLLASGRPFIFDGSQDRHWAARKQQFTNAGYHWFVIDMELSKEFLVELFNATGRSDFARDHLDNYLKQHQDFMRQHSDDIGLRITDETFPDRLQLSVEALQKFIDSLSE
jgi:hypothetical protein